MTSEPLLCPRCAAPQGDASSAACGFCGSALAPASPAAPRRTGTEELLASVARHPDFAAWQAWTPPLGGLRLGYVRRGTIAAAFAGLAACLAAAGLEGALEGGPPAAFLSAALSAALVLLGGWYALASWRAALGLKPASVRGVAVLVADEREQVQRSRWQVRTRGRQLALQFADGTLSALRVEERLAPGLVPGDYGLAWLAGGRLLEFRRVGSR